MNLLKYTLPELIAAVESSVSIRECLIKLGVAPYGGNYGVFHNAIKHFNIDISHFTGMNLKGRTLPQRRKPINEYLQKNSNIKSFKLKNYLIESNIFEKKCVSCKLTEWLNEPIPLELDHIDGDNSNNELSNLRLLCPNCHAKTSTYRGKNKKKNAGAPSRT
jgi:Zn finger protein HypA/HybF involved in hydrogenase expression